MTALSNYDIKLLADSFEAPQTSLPSRVGTEGVFCHNVNKADGTEESKE